MMPVEPQTDYPFVEPFICPEPRGCSIMSQNLSIEEYFHARSLEDLFEGPLSDVECYYSSDGEDKTQPAEARSVIDAKLVASTPPSSGRRGRDTRRSAARRRKKRSALQMATGILDKQVAKKRRLEATKDAIVLDYSLPSDNNATKPGWIGKRVADLPQRVYSLAELVNDYDMKRFRWDGLYVPFPLLLHTYPDACLDPRTSCSIDMGMSLESFWGCLKMRMAGKRL